MAKAKIKTAFEKSTFGIIADGLDGCVDPKRGWTAEHERAKNLADAAPVMLDVLRELIADVYAIGEETVKKEWPDLFVTYQHAIKACPRP